MIRKINTVHSEGIFTFFMLFILILTSCNKDIVNNEGESDCVSIPPHSQPGPEGYSFIIDEKNVGNPYFNPNSDDEFLFLRANTSNSSYSDVYTYDIQSHEQKLIYSGNVIYQPVWGQNDWILFSTLDYNCYIIKSNGDSLTKLTSESCYHYPVWAFNTNQFRVYNQCIGKDILFDFNGYALDTLPHIVGPTSNLNKQPYILNNAGPTNKIFLYNTDSESYELEYDYQNTESPASGSSIWLNNNEIIYTNEAGLNKLNISTLNNTLIRNGCNAKSFLYGSINQSKTKMIWSKIVKKKLDENTVSFKKRIVIMDVDGTNEQELELSI